MLFFFSIGAWNQGRSQDFRGQVGNLIVRAFFMMWGPRAPLPPNSKTLFLVLRVSGNFLHIFVSQEVRAGQFVYQKVRAGGGRPPWPPPLAMPLHEMEVLGWGTCPLREPHFSCVGGRKTCSFFVTIFGRKYSQNVHLYLSFWTKYTRATREIYSEPNVPADHLVPPGCYEMLSPQIPYFYC